MNMFLGRELTSSPLRRLDRGRMIAVTESVLKELDVRIPSVRAIIRELSGGQRQGVAIARATHWAASHQRHWICSVFLNLCRGDAAVEVIRGGQGDLGQEICGEVERRGARTAGGDDLRGQASGTVADEGAHPVEGGRVGGGRRLERQRDLGGVGHQHQQYRPHPASTGRRRDRGGADPQIQSELRPAADFRRGGEAKLIALTCSPAPEGFAHWSLRLLEEKVVELNIVEKASDNTIGRTLKKTSSSPTAIGNG